MGVSRLDWAKSQIGAQTFCFVAPVRRFPMALERWENVVSKFEAQGIDRAIG